MLPYVFALVIIVMGIANKVLADDTISQKLVPHGVLQTKDVISNQGGIVRLKDRSLMLAAGRTYRVSKDEGKTWSSKIPLPCSFGALGMIR